MPSLSKLPLVPSILGGLHHEYGLKNFQAMFCFFAADETAAQHPGITQDRTQRRPQFVRKNGDEFIFDAIRLTHVRI